MCTYYYGRVSLSGSSSAIWAAGMTSMTSLVSYNAAAAIAASLAIDKVLADPRDRPFVALEACEFVRNWELLMDYKNCPVSP